MGVVVPTTAVPTAGAGPMAGTKAEEDSTLAEEDIPAARAFGAWGRPHHDRWVAARIAGLVVRPVVRASIPGTSVADHLAQMARAT